MNYDELIDEYGGGPQIPSSELYNYLLLVRQDLINEAKLGIRRIPDSSLGREVRRRCKTDLMWLARYFTWISNPASENGTKDFTENIFDEEFYGSFPELFVKKDPDKSIFQQSEIKTRMLLWSRGGAKSTYDHVDTVQWILCFPSIRILYLTAEKSLAEGFLSEIQGHFYIKEEDDPTWMQLFFPEFCVEEGKTGAKNTFTCPVYADKKTGRKEPTVYASSVGKNKAGWRYELIKADDAVSDTNSETDLLCEKISKALFLAEKLLALGGAMIDYIGTRYADGDHYGIVLEQNKDAVVIASGKGWELLENKATNTRILIGRAMQIKPEVLDRLQREGKPPTYQEAGPDGVVLLLPHKMDYAWCMADFTKDEKSFEGQRNQNPRVASQSEFDRMMLLKATVPFNLMPRYGPCSQVWDFASSQKKGTDFSVGTSVVWSETDQIGNDGKKTNQRMTTGYVRKVVRDRFNNLTLAQSVVALAVEDRPFVIGIEDAQGSRHLEPTIISEAYKTGDQYIIALCEHIDWFTPDQQKDAKRMRMGSLYPWIVEARLFFANYCMQPKYPNLDVLYNEFEKCLTDHHHDDIPDNLGYQVRYAPRATQAIVENNESMFSRYDQGWNEIFEEGWTDSRGMRLTTDANGNVVTWDPTQTFVIQDEFMPEQYEEENYNYYGLPKGTFG